LPSDHDTLPSDHESTTHFYSLPPEVASYSFGTLCLLTGAWRTAFGRACTYTPIGRPPNRASGGLRVEASLSLRVLLLLRALGTLEQRRALVCSCLDRFP
jgi:hypothetical protein